MKAIRREFLKPLDHTEDFKEKCRDKENGERKPTIFRGGIASRLDKAQRLMV